MNDRYLFKAKRTDNGEWEQGYYAYYPNGFGSEVREDHIIKDTIRGRVYFIDPTTLCQCTGLKDKAGNLIWENDILRYEYGGKIKVDVIKYDAPMFTYSRAIRWDLCLDEVLGNIFDNPELLEEV